MVDRLQADDVDLPALGHPPHITGVAGEDHDMIRVRGLDCGAEVRVSDGDAGPLDDSGGGIGAR
jgi:hypothetical protein